MNRSIWAFLSITLLLTSCLPAFADSYDDGLTAYKARNFKLAAQKFEQAIKQEPGNSTVYYLTAICKQLSGDTANARRYYQSIMQNFPGTEASEKAAQALGLGASVRAPGYQEYKQNENHKSANTSRGKESESSVDPDIAAAPEVTKIYFEKDHKNVVIDVQVNGRPVKMIFDTGAEGCVFGKNNLSEMGINHPQGKATGKATGVGSTEGHETWDLSVDIKVGGITRHHFPVMVQEKMDQPLLGETFFKDFHYTIDNATNTIVFTKKSNNGTASDYTGYDPNAVPFRVEGKEMIVSVQVSGRNIDMIFDTGANGISFTEKQLKDIGISVPEDAEAGKSVGVSGETESKLFNVSRIKMGPIDKSDIRVSCESKSAAGHPLIGQDFFGEWKFTVDNEKKVIHFVRR